MTFRDIVETTVTGQLWPIVDADLHVLGVRVNQDVRSSFKGWVLLVMISAIK